MYTPECRSPSFKDLVEQYWKFQSLATKVAFLNSCSEFIISRGVITFSIKEKFYNEN